MLKQAGRWNAILSSCSMSPLLSRPCPSKYCNGPTATAIISTICEPPQWSSNQGSRVLIPCSAGRRRVRYEEEEDEEGYGHNEEVSMLELYSQTARGEALIVHAVVDEQDVQVLIFKGFSSSLSYQTFADPSRCVLPARAVIKSVDRIKGPFHPSNIEYLEKGLAWEAFKSRLVPQ